ncbi:YncE family protein [Amphritea sp.]|uniref:YncE family protein n=1 Tax=Amphritea sp. TaxID=1872502 RepID=UPI0025BB8343|nr:YncE family protein [Amphritea sp.]
MKTTRTKQTSFMLIGLFSSFYSLSSISAPTVYIPLGSGNGIAAVDAATDKVIEHFTGVKNPHGLVATQDGEYLLAGSINEDAEKTKAGEENNSSLFLVHPAHGHVMQTIPVAGWSHHQAITPDGRYVLSTHPTRNHVSVVDVQRGSQIKLIPTNNGPYYILVTRDGKRAYVSNSGASTVQEINTENWTVTRTINAGPSPEHMVLSKDENVLYVNNSRKGTLSLIPLNAPEDRQEVSIAESLHGLDISDDGKHLFISSKSEGKLIVFTPETGDKVTVPLSPNPYHLNTIPGTGKVYVSSRSEPTVWVIDQSSFKLINSFQLPAGEGHQMSIINQ